MDEVQNNMDELKLIPAQSWWWAGWSVLSVAGLILNILFLIIIIKQRKSRELRSLLTAALAALAILDIQDIIRIVPGIISNLHSYSEFRLTYCSLGVFHSVGVALLLTLATLYLIVPCRDTPPLYYPAATCSGSVPQKVLVPLCLCVGGGAAGCLFLLPQLYQTIVDGSGLVQHSCLDYTRVVHLADGTSETFWSDLYQTIILGVAVAIPLLLAPPAILISSVRCCMKGQCCHAKQKQSAGEMLCVLLVILIYLGTHALVALSRLNQTLELGVELPPEVPVLWELGNATARPMIYFLCNPGVWEGLKSLCACRKHMSDSYSLKEEEVALNPVVERVSSI